MGAGIFAPLHGSTPQAIQKIASILSFDGIAGGYRRNFVFRNFSLAARTHFQSKAMATENEGASNVVVYVTVPNKETGRALAKSIVSEKLAACVNQIPGIESTYWWQGKVETESEELLVIKTGNPLLKALTEHIALTHPYDVPEVIALPIVGGSPEYLKWLGDNTKAE